MSSATPAKVSTREERTASIAVGFVIHRMYVAGAEILVAKAIEQLGDRISPTIFCLDEIGPMGEEFQARGFDVVSLDRTPGIDWRLPGRFAKELADRNIQVVHAHQYTPFFYTALASMRMLRKRPRIIFTEHGRHFPDVVSSKRRFLNKWVLQRFADRTNACCKFSADAVVELEGFNGEGVEVLTNGIEVDRYSPTDDRQAVAAELGLPAGRRFVTMIARFHPVKDHPTLVRAFQKVAERFEDVDLLLVGDGPDRKLIENLIEELGIQSRAHLLGVRNDVPRILQAVDVFALTSISEAASLTLLEAMATGVPVVVTDVGGNGEIVRQDVDGLLAPRGDSAAVAEALAKLLSEPARARLMGDSARQRVLDEFRLENTIEGYWQLYRDLAH